MVVCKYFLQGRCLYGAQCRNEHTTYDSRPPPPNVFGTPQKSVSFGASGAGGNTTPINYATMKRALDEEIRLTQGGKQWPFSCICPLKDGGNIPILEDISPEELRFEAYQAQSQNNFDAYKNRFEQLKKESDEKHAAILSLDVKSLENLCSSGNFSGATSSSSVFGSRQNSNPFQSSNSTFGSNTSSPKPFGQTSLFGQTATTPQSSLFGSAAPATPTGGLFASAAAATQPVFGEAAPALAQKTSFGQSNLFGQQTTSAFTQSAGNVFGQSSQTQAPAQNLFGQAPQSVFGQASQSQPSNLFGQSSTFGQQTSAAQANLFGQAAQPSSGNLFGQPPAFGQTPGTPQPSAVTQPPFGQPLSNAASGLFSQSASSTTNAGSIFGQKSLFGQQTSQPGNIFGQASSTPAGGLFAQAVQSPASNTSTNLFAQPTTPNTNLFGQAATPTTQSSTTGNLFGQAGQTIQPAGNLFGQSGNSLFGQTTQQASSTPFAAPAYGQQSNLFGQQTLTPAVGSIFGQTPSTPQPTPPSGLFAAAAVTAQPPSFAQITPTSSAVSPSPFSGVPAFGQQPTASIFASATSTSSPFAKTQEPASVFAQTDAVNLNPFTQAPAGNHYSKLEDLENFIIEAFTSDSFKLGSIPVVPPPSELCF
ncbi:nucleoporin NUP42-like [Neocloeon triangulifer]|uniref:nucleoporin NUP42-like n=1 Tax=Neocloeon triangulifer TaxID=2078957 RepID=UPI00286ECDA8|nr:nucleoporin NUP42-like [Neocloeon triangulifer]